MKPYEQREGAVIRADGRFAHVMALALDPRSEYREGVIRCVMSREGDVAVKGFLDRSALFRAQGGSLDHFAITAPLSIRNERDVVRALADGGQWDFIGLEDPDIWVDPGSGLVHVYFTMPFIHRAEKKNGAAINLGHAVGRDLDSLEMADPVLRSCYMGGEAEGAKEVSIAPVNTQGVRLNLVESSCGRGTGRKYSTVRVAIAEDMNGPWRYGDTVFHPGEEHISWIGGHASPGPLFPREFIDVGKNKVLGAINGREADRRAGERIEYGAFSVGLFIYDYENGAIDWVSPEPFIRDSEARTITFASQFVGTGKGAGILYAHVDDSFVRAYALHAEAMKSLLP